MTAGAAALSGWRKGAVLLVPWVFLVVFATLYLLVLVPKVLGGSIIAGILALFAAVVFVCFAVAAVTFSRDVTAGRYP